MMRRLIAFLFALACVSPAFAQSITGGGGGGSLATPVSVANGGTGTGTAGITAFNNITGYTATGATGTTSTNVVFSTSPTISGLAITGANTCGASCSLNFSQSSSTMKLNSVAIWEGAALSSCTSPTGATGGACAVTSSAGSMAMKLTLSVTSGSFTGTTMTLTFPVAAANGYLCDGVDITNGEHLQTTAFTSTTVTTITLYNAAGTATAPGTADVLYLKCVSI